MECDDEREAVVNVDAAADDASCDSLLLPLPVLMLAAVATLVGLLALATRPTASVDVSAAAAAAACFDFMRFVSDKMTPLADNCFSFSD